MTQTDIFPERALLEQSEQWAHRVPAQAADLPGVLKKRLSGEVRFDTGSRALYATDLSIYRQPPIGAVIPRTIEDVIITVDGCRQRDIPILGRGCGTSLAGQTCDIAVIIDFSKYLNGLLAVDPGAKTARVEPGIIRDDLDHAARPHRARRKHHCGRWLQLPRADRSNDESARDAPLGSRRDGAAA